MKKLSVVITGGIQGIGFEIGKYFLSNSDFHLCIIDKESHVENMEFLKEHFPNRFSIFQVDLSSVLEATNITMKITEEFLPKILVNNLGSRNKASFTDETGDAFNLALNTIVVSNFLLSRSFLQFAKKEGLNTFRIVNIGSILGDVIGPQSPSYHIAKGALQSLTRYFSVEGKAYVSDLSVILLQIGFIVQHRNQKKFDLDLNSKFRRTIDYYQGTSNIYSDKDIAINVFHFSTGESVSMLNGSIINLDYGSQNKENLDLLLSYKKND